MSPIRVPNATFAANKGKFTTKQVKVGRSLAADRRSKSKTVVKKGEGDHGDQRRAG